MSVLDRTDEPQIPKPSGRGPASPMPGLFAPDPSQIQQKTSDGRPLVHPSDLMTNDDYRALRWNAFTHATAGMFLGGFGSVFLARRLFPRFIGPNGQVFLGVTTAFVCGTVASAMQIRQKLDSVEKEAWYMNHPKAEGGGLLFGDRASSDDKAQAFEDPPSVPAVAPVDPSLGSTGIAKAQAGERWSRLGEGRQEELRDPFFRPGVPRREV